MGRAAHGGGRPPLSALRRLVPGDGVEPVLVTAPSQVRHVVVLIPAPTEPRAGRHSAFAQWSELWARHHGVASVTADMPGGGDSLAPPSTAAWIRQHDALLSVARELAGDAPIHQLARGAGCALWSDQVRPPKSAGVRIALSPPTASECRHVADLVAGEAQAELADAEPASYVLGSTTFTAGNAGLAGLLRWAAAAVETPCWEYELHVAARTPRADAYLPFGDVDPLARLEVTRRGIGSLLGDMFDEIADPENWC